MTFGLSAATKLTDPTNTIAANIKVKYRMRHILRLPPRLLKDFHWQR